MVTVAKTKMIVRPTSRILSAISFGVFWRSAPSTSLIIRSRKVDPRAAVMRTRIQSESTCVPPVTAELANDRSRLAGDRRLIDGGDAFDHLAVRGDEVASLHQNHVAHLKIGAGDALVVLPVGASQELCLRLCTLASQRFGLRLATAFSDGFGKVGE